MSNATSEIKVTSDELCDRLGIDRAQLRKLVKDGLPANGRTKNRSFDLSAVVAWLQERDLIEVDPPDEPSTISTETIASTRAEAARMLGLGADGERTISKWLALPGFPGRSGTPGKQDGHFPIEKIREWRDDYRSAGRAGGVGDDGELREAKRRLVLLEIEEQELAAKQRLGQLLDFNEVATFYEQSVANTKAVLSQIADEVLAILPADTSDEVKDQVYRKVQRRVDDACAEIAQLLEGDTDPTSDEDEDDRTSEK